MNETLLSRRAALRLAAGLAATATIARIETSQGAPPTRGKGVEASPGGHLRPGPLGFGPAPVLSPSGVHPVGIRIDKAQVDAPIEVVQIVDGVMENPSGPWVVSWYEQTARPGQPGNVLMSGHVDYWDVGPAVFWNLKDLVAEDEIVVVGEDETTFTYGVTWTQNYEVASLTPEAIGEIVGPTKRESLTLITCGGVFDSATGEYLERYVVRAERVV